jgi:2-amino-4-hydroxy-6-hydroxymethyldihydropteridine diphosphokinase
MNKAYLLMGGNIGDRELYLATAEKKMDADCGKIEKKSALYQTEAWGLEDQAPFLNKSVQIKTSLSPIRLLQSILEIETSIGRKREKKFGPRIIDIDILFFNDEIIHTQDLIIPHPQLQNRRFALQCLNDIAADVIHPVLKKSISQLLEECSDPLKVYKF